jgi:hypothetical protein
MRRDACCASDCSLRKLRRVEGFVGADLGASLRDSVLRYAAASAYGTASEQVGRHTTEAIQASADRIPDTGSMHDRAGDGCSERGADANGFVFVVRDCVLVTRTGNCAVLDVVASRGERKGREAAYDRTNRAEEVTYCRTNR